MPKFRQHVAATVLVSAIAAFPFVAATQTTDREALAGYAACMSLAQTDPTRAFDEAETWAAQGGGEAAQHCAAISLFGMGRHIEAAQRLERLAGGMAAGAIGPRARVLAQAGQAWLLAGEGGRAQQALSQALELTPGDIELLIDRSIAWATSGQYWEAVDDLNLATEISPDRADVLVLRASAYRSLEAPDLASDDLSRALALDPGNPDGLLERGILRRLAGDAAGARADWTKIIETDPGSPAAVAARGNLDNLE
jgi:tetratricopeptide (TPR) repeat protein